MLDLVLEKIDDLPPVLPKTLEEVEKFRKKPNKEVEELANIIEKDALLVSTLLKIANSSMFGFRSKVETISRIINLLGINFTVFVAVNQTIKETIKADLSAYGICCEKFMNISISSSLLAKYWLEEINHEFKEDIFLANILQELGKFILSGVIVESEFYTEFKKEIDSGENNIIDIEKKYLNITTSKISAEMLRYWEFNYHLINIIEYVDDIEKCHEEYREISQILDVLKTACSVTSLLSDKSVEKALQKAVAYNLETEPLKKAIEILKSRLE